MQCFSKTFYFCCFGVFLQLALVWWQPTVMVAHSDPPCLSSITFSTLPFAFWLPLKWKTIMQRRYPGNIPLPVSCLPHPWWGCSFPWYPRGASFIFVLRSSQKVLMQWVQWEVGRSGGLCIQCLSFECSPHKHCIVPIKDLVLGNCLLDSHQGLYKYYFHLVWPFVVL